jgi:hypothetical protein
VNPSVEIQEIVDDGGEVAGSAGLQTPGEDAPPRTSAAEQRLQFGEHHLPRLAAQNGRSGRVRALSQYEPCLAVVVVELDP